VQAEAAAQDTLVGTLLVGKYRIVRILGKGGMGVVYEGVHVELDKRIAIKMMLEKYSEDGEAMARFRREALAATRIGNPHIIDIIDFGVSPEGRPYVVMEYLVGQSLGDIIKRSGPMLPYRAVKIMRQTLRAVGAAHAKGIIHRDLKPDNIFIVNQPVDNEEDRDFVKLLDFGISKIVDTAAEIAATKLTTTGMVMGTPLYMAPEQAMGENTDHLADIYALGVILYEMLAGKPPFDGATYPILVAKLLTADPELLSEARPGTPAALVAAVHRALEKTPSSRFASCEAFAQALPQLNPSSSTLELAQTLDSGKVAAVGKPITFGGTGGKNAVTQAGPSRGNKLLILGAVGAALVVGTVALLLALRGGDEAPKAIVDPIETVKTNEGSASPDLTLGGVMIRSIPDGATARVDGVVVGTTPIRAETKAGVHKVRVELDGVGIEDSYNVVAGKDIVATLKLPAAVPDPGPKPVPGPGSNKIRTKPPLIIKKQDLPHVEPTPPPGAGGTVNVAPPPVEKTVPKTAPPRTNPTRTNPTPVDPYGNTGSAANRRANPYQ